MGNKLSTVIDLLNVYGNEPWLVLRSAGLGREEGKHLAIYLLESETGGVASLIHLDLSSNSLDSEALEDLMQVLTQDRAIIQEINLSNNPICDEGCQMLQPLFETSWRMRVAKFDSCRISDEGVALLMAAMRRNFDCDMRRLSLRGNEITRVGIHALIRACWKPNPKATVDINTGQFVKEKFHVVPLEWLDLDDNDIGDEGAELLSFALKDNNFVRLVRLSLRANNISAGGARKLGASSLSVCLTSSAVMMAYTPTLASLDLRDNEYIEESAALVLSEALDNRDPVCAGGEVQDLHVYEPEIVISGGDWYWERLKKALNPRLRVDTT